MPGYGFWQGAERTTGQMTATGMRLLEMRGTEQHRRALEADSATRLRIAEETANIQNAKGQIELDEAKKQEAFLNSGWEPSIDPIIKKLPEADQKEWLDRISQAKIPSTQRGRNQVQQLISSDTKWFGEYSKSAYTKTMSDYQAIEAEYLTALQKDPQKAAEIKPRYDAAAQAVHRQKGMIDQGFKMVGMMEAWGKLSENVKQDPSLLAAFEMGIRSGDDTQFNKILLELTKQEGKGEATRLDEWKISELMAQNPGLSSQEATGIILGTIKVLQDPVSGTRNLVDTVAGTERPLVEAGGKPPVSKTSAPPTKSIWELSSKSTGPISAAKAAGSVVTGTVGLPVAEETLYARQFVQGAQNDLIRSLSINPRFPVGEINRLKEEVNLAPTIFDNPKMMRQRILAINDYLSKRVKNEMDAAKDTSLGVEARKNARSAANDIENFLDILGAPRLVNTQEEYKSLPPGTQYIDSQGNEGVKGRK